MAMRKTKIRAVKAAARKKKKRLKLSKRIPPRKKAKARIISRTKVLKKQQIRAGSAKFYTGGIQAGEGGPRAVSSSVGELPSRYDQDKLLLQVRDPWWLYAYWEVRGRTLDGLKNSLGDDFYQARRILRVYDVSYIIFNGKNAHRFFDIQINEQTDNWYIDTGGPGRSWCVDLGLLLPGGKFITILRSNIVQTPLDGPSWITDEEWSIPEDMFSRLYGMGFGFGQGSFVGKKGWQKKLRRELFSGVMASPGFSSSVNPAKKAAK